MKILLDLKRVSNYGRNFREIMNKKIDEILENQKNFKINDLAESLADLMDPTTVSLLEEHKAFKANATAQMNKRLSDPDLGLKYVLKNISGAKYEKPAEGVLENIGAFFKKGLDLVKKPIKYILPQESKKEMQKIDCVFLRNSYNKFLMEYGVYD